MKKVQKIFLWATGSLSLFLILSQTTVGQLQIPIKNNVFPDSGNVGIGTTIPKAKLHVIGDENNGTAATLTLGSGTQTMLLDGNEIDAQKDGLHLNYNSDGKVSIARGGGNVAIGKANAETKLDVAGTTRTKILEITGGSDLAEPFELVNAKSAKSGMVVSIDPERLGQLRIANQAYDRTVAGIISGANGLNTGLLMKKEDSTVDGSLPVALTGRVYCWADASKISIQPGDLLTTSNIPGHTMKVTDYSRAQGAIIGKAMSSLKTGRGLILVLVSLQ